LIERIHMAAQMQSQLRYRVALWLAFVSGAAGLTHQLLWTRRLIDLLGADAGTFARVIGAFFAGLALGAWCASRPVRRPTRFWSWIAWAELAVAVLAVPVLLSAHFADWLWRQPAIDGWLNLLGPPLLVLPPALFMGLVLPWMLRALAHGMGSDGSVRIYAANLLGGIGGIILVMYLGLPRLGLLVAGAVAIGLNLVAALIAVILASQTEPTEETPNRLDAESSKSVGDVWTIRGLAFVSGFLVLAAEVVVQHQFAQVTINSMFSAATVLVLVLAALMVGALLVPAAIRWLGSDQRVLWMSLCAATVCWSIQPFLLVGLTGGLQMLAYDMSPAAYTLQVATLGLLTIGLPFVAAGILFPLVLRTVTEQGARAPRREVGLLFAWNGLGGWLGAEFTSGWIAPGAGLWGSVWWIALVYWVLALKGMWSLREDRWSRTVRRPAIAITGLGLAATAVLLNSLPQAGISGRERVAAFEVSREGVVTAVERGPDDWRILFNNSYSLGGSRSQFNQERQAHLPLLLHAQARTAALLGVATGSTTAGAALHADLEQIDAIELSPAVLRFARDHFGPYNRNVFDDARLRVIPADARRVMARERNRYDVVIGDLFLPWRTGEGRLFTREHFENVRGSLRPDGLYCQWLPLFQLTRTQFDVIARTFLTVFPDAFVIRGDFYARRPIVGLVGGRSLDSLDWDRIDAASALLRYHGKTTDPLVRHVDGVAMLVIGPLAQPPAGPVNTLRNAWLEWDAGRNILGRQEPWFVGVPFGEYSLDLQQRGADLLPSTLHAAHDAGQFFLTLDIATHSQNRAPAELMWQIPNRLPRSLATDQVASWRYWPMRLNPGPARNSTDGSATHSDRR
jgi:spermidine synthase